MTSKSSLTESVRDCSRQLIWIPLLLLLAAWLVALTKAVSGQRLKNQQSMRELDSNRRNLSASCPSNWRRGPDSS